MTVRKRPGKTPDILHTFQLFLFNRAEAGSFTRLKDKYAKTVREFVQDNGVVEKDEDGNEVTGNIVYLFPESIVVGAKAYSGAELRKQAVLEFDEEAALALIKKKGIPAEQVTHTEVIVDQDAFYVLNQQGKITDFELDDLLVEKAPKYSFWPIESSAEDADPE